MRVTIVVEASGILARLIAFGETDFIQRILVEIPNDIYMDVMLESSCISFGHTREQD